VSYGIERRLNCVQVDVQAFRPLSTVGRLFWRQTRYQCDFPATDLAPSSRKWHDSGHSVSWTHRRETTSLTVLPLTCYRFVATHCRTRYYIGYSEPFIVDVASSVSLLSWQPIAAARKLSCTVVGRFMRFYILLSAIFPEFYYSQVSLKRRKRRLKLISSLSISAHIMHLRSKLMSCWLFTSRKHHPLCVKIYCTLFTPFFTFAFVLFIILLFVDESI